jgi:hypothetical protein
MRFRCVRLIAKVSTLTKNSFATDAAGRGSITS